METRRIHALKWLAAIATLASLFATGCGSGGSGGGPTTLRVAASFATPADKAALAAVISDFTRTHADIKVNVTYTPIAQYDQVLGTQIAGGNAPDLMYVQPGAAHTTGAIPLAKKGALLDLSDQSWTKRIPASMRGLVTEGGKVYAWPQEISFEGMIYNQSVLDRLKVAIPTTPSEVVTYCRKLKTAGVTPYELYLQDVFGGYQLLYSLVATTVYEKTPDWDQQRMTGKTTFAATPGWRGALQTYLELRDAGCFQKSPNGTPISQALAALTTGKAGGTPSVSVVLALAQQANPKGRFAMAPFPGADAGNAVTGGPLTAWAVSARTQHKAAALTFLRYVSDPKVNREIARRAGNIATVDFAALKLPPGLARFVPYLRRGDLHVLPGLNWPAGIQDTTLGPGIQALFSGSQSVSGLLRQLDNAWNAGARR